MAAEDLATAVSRASAAWSSAELADRAGLAPKTLRAILSGDTERRFGRRTLDKLDDALGWPPGTAWRTYRLRNALVHGLDEVAVDEMAAWRERVEERLSELEETDDWVTQVVEICRRIAEPDRALLIELLEVVARFSPRG